MREHTDRQWQGLVCRQPTRGRKQLTEDAGVGLVFGKFKHRGGKSSRQPVITGEAALTAEPRVLPIPITQQPDGPPSEVRKRTQQAGFRGCYINFGQLVKRPERMQGGYRVLSENKLLQLLGRPLVTSLA